MSTDGQGLLVDGRIPSLGTGADRAQCQLCGNILTPVRPPPPHPGFPLPAGHVLLFLVQGLPVTYCNLLGNIERADLGQLIEEFKYDGVCTPSEYSLPTCVICNRMIVQSQHFNLLTYMISTDNLYACGITRF